MPTFSSKSQEKLATCHPDIGKIFDQVVWMRDCTIIEGHRSQGLNGCLMWWPRSPLSPYS